MQHKNYQIKISLKNSKPKIWRRIVIDSNTLLGDFHRIIQTTMGWTNSHLHQFKKDKTFYLEQLDAFDLFSFHETINYVEGKIKVSDLLVKEKEKIIYEYDFGDGWEHEIVLEKIIISDIKLKVPVCLAGKMNCPPEDCGGVWGYQHLIDVLQNPKHPDHEEMMDWYDMDLDTEYFDLEEINEYLMEEDFGCTDFLLD